MNNTDKALMRCTKRELVNKISAMREEIASKEQAARDYMREIDVLKTKLNEQIGCTKRELVNKISAMREEIASKEQAAREEIASKEQAARDYLKEIEVLKIKLNEQIDLRNLDETVQDVAHRELVASLRARIDGLQQAIRIADRLSFALEQANEK